MRSIILILSTLLLFACSSTPENTTVQDQAATHPQNGEEVKTQGIGEPESWQGSPLDNPNSPLFTKTIYFDFDQAIIRPEYIPILKAHAEYLLQNPRVHLVIEGHCDERGSREYNIALGERRALVVKRFLEAQGVNPIQLSTISYGEEMPVALGHDEAAWAQNRRAELVYQ